MTDEQVKLVDAFAKMSIGSICALALAVALYFQHGMTTRFADMHEKHLQESRLLMQESNQIKAKMADLLVQLLNDR